MTVRQLIEELMRLPPQVQEQDVLVKVGDGWGRDLDSVVWKGNVVQLEA